MHTTDAEECRIEYSKSWIKACLFNYMLGRGSQETLEHDIHGKDLRDFKGHISGNNRKPSL